MATTLPIVELIMNHNDTPDALREELSDMAAFIALANTSGIRIAKMRFPLAGAKASQLREAVKLSISGTQGFPSPSAEALACEVVGSIDQWVKDTQRPVTTSAETPDVSKQIAAMQAKAAKAAKAAK